MGPVYEFHASTNKITVRLLRCGHIWSTVVNTLVSGKKLSAVVHVLTVFIDNVSMH